jgi:hypothetical protein
MAEVQTVESSMPEVQHLATPMNPVISAPDSTLKDYSRRRVHKQSVTVKCLFPVRSLVAELVQLASALISRPVPKRRVKQLSTDFVP